MTGKIVTVEMMQEFLTLSALYASRKNLDVEQYITGMLKPLIRDFDVIDEFSVLSNLLRYHREWLK